MVILGKEGCHLCEAVEAEVRRVAGIRVEVVDVGRDPELHDRYWLRVPVVTVRGREVFEAKMMDLEGRWKGRLPSLLRG